MPSHLSFFCAPSLSEEQTALWKDFALGVPWAHYRQDQAWAETERSGRGMAAREPWFFWAEADGTICLTGVGVRRRLPVPGRVFWEFNKGPNFVDPTVLDEWLSWLLPRIRRGAARLRVGPAIPLDRGGENVEAILKRHGFACISEWATLLVDISGNEDEIMASFRPATQRSIKKSRRLGIEIHPEDTPDGWGAIAALQTELSRTSSTSPVDKPAIERVSRHWLRGGSGGTILVARHHGEALAAVMLVIHRGTAYTPIIPSSHRHREFPATHLLVWEAMRWAKQRGCTVLDLAGYSLQAQPGEQVWGINQFKRGFASLDQISTSVGIYQVVFSPVVAALAAAGRKTQAWLPGHSGNRAR
jgi:peptidoglycan pentaglycine glycine transferase (the first glycine)